MINGFHAAKSGMMSFQSSLDVVANNIANADTEGYQARSIHFADLVYTRSQGLDVVAGNGARAVSTSFLSESGALRTGDALDASIVGEGYYAVLNPREGAEDARLYARNSAFSLASEGDQVYLKTASGEYVLDGNGQRIQVQGGDLDAAFAQVALYAFPNPDGLTALGDGLFAAGDASGQPVADAASQIVPGISESAGVNLASEMSNMMIAQRGFQLSARMLQTADEIEQTVNGLRG
jgi:flagellar basal-body rod protein FlgG